MTLLQRVLFALAAGFWLGTGALAVSGILDLGAGTGGAPVLGALMPANDTALALTGWFSLRGHCLLDFAALAVAAVNTRLSLTDEIAFWTSSPCSSAPRCSSC